MYLNKLENLEPYKEYFGPTLSVISEENREEKRKSLEQQLPKSDDFYTKIKKAVEGMKIYYQYETNERIQSDLTGENCIWPENYIYIVKKVNFDFYITFLGAIDKNLDKIQETIKLGNKKINEKWLNLREKIVKTCKDEMGICNDSIYDEVMRNYPTYSSLEKLYETKSYENKIPEDGLNFCIAYNEGYISGEYLCFEQLEEEYNKSLEEIKKEKEINDEEYRKAVTRTRK